jgi:4-carboxymuconolactone decarboxylase
MIPLRGASVGQVGAYVPLTGRSPPIRNPLNKCSFTGDDVPSYMQPGSTTMSDLPPRLPLLDPDNLTDEQRAVFWSLGPVQAGQTVPESPGEAERVRFRNHIYRTLAHHPPLATRFLDFNGYLLAPNTLPIRIRQIAIHRVAWIRGCVYMWSSHLRVSLPLGLVREDFEAVKVGPRSGHWTLLEHHLVLAVDQLVERSAMNDATWQALTTELDDQQMMDLVFTVGCYTLLTMFMNTFRIGREPELKLLADEYGAPEPPMDSA